MNPEKTTHVLIVDDHPVVREGFAAILEYLPDMTVVGRAASGSEAVRLFRQHRPDVTLMDLRMPEMDGVQAIEKICMEFPGAGIIVLTTFSGDEDIYRALHAGARGYLLKDAPVEELLKAIRVVRTGKKYVPSDVALKLVERISSMELTAREMEVLRLMATGQSNQEIAQALSIVEGTVKTHAISIFNKLGVHDRTQAVTAALRRGILTLE